MTIFWSRSLKGVHGAWKTPGFAFLAPLLVELQPTFGVIFGILAVFAPPQRGTWGTHGRPRALGLPFGRYIPGLVPFWSRFGPRSQPQGGQKKAKNAIYDKSDFSSKAALFGARARTPVPPGHGTTSKIHFASSFRSETRSHRCSPCGRRRLDICVYWRSGN